MHSRRQLVLCVGPRCLRRGGMRALLSAAERLCARHPGWSFATYACLGRCPTGPNGLVRNLAPEDDPEAAPGYRQLDAGVPLSHLTSAAIEALPQQPCASQVCPNADDEHDATCPARQA